MDAVGGIFLVIFSLCAATVLLFIIGVCLALSLFMTGYLTWKLCKEIFG